MLLLSACQTGSEEQPIPHLAVVTAGDTVTAAQLQLRLAEGRVFFGDASFTGVGQRPDAAGQLREAITYRDGIYNGLDKASVRQLIADINTLRRE